MLFQHKLYKHKLLYCEHCSRSFQRKSAMIHHLLSSHVKSVDPTHECDSCQKKFLTKTSLKSHKYAVHRQKVARVTCELCGQSFYAKYFLNKHIVTAHTDKSERLAMRKQCEFCGEWLLTKSGVFYHKQVMGKTVWFFLFIICRVINFIYQFWQLHTSGTQACEHCGVEFPNRPSLLGHIRQYHRPHKFNCSYCPKTFVTAAKLKVTKPWQKW